MVTLRPLEDSEILNGCDSKMQVKSPFRLSNNSDQRFFYGWLILAVCFFITLCGMGIRQTLGVFVLPMEGELGWTRAEVTRVLSIGILVGALSFTVVGMLHDKYGGRIVISVSLAIFGLSLILMGRISSLGMFLLIHGVIGSFATSGISFVVIHSMLARWFQRKRTLVLSLSSAGGSMGALVFAPLSAYLIALSDWRIAFIILGVFILAVVVPLSAFLLRNEPSDIGLTPDGDNDDLEGGPGAEIEREEGPFFTNNWREALKTPPFWQLSFAYVVCGITTNIISIHFVPYAEEQGVNPITAATIFGVMMGLNSIGVLTAGFLSQKFEQKKVLALTYALRGVAYLALLTLGGLAGMWAFAVIAGMSWIATVPVTTSITADVYGIRNLGTINGLINLAHQLGGAVMVFLSGELYEMTGSYMLPFGIAGITLIAASFSAFSIREKIYSQRYNSFRREMVIVNPNAA